MRPGTALILALAALVHFGLWALVHAPVSAPEWRGGPIAGLSFNPTRPGQDPRRGDQPSIAEIERDLALLEGRVGALRGYDVAGVLGAIPALAAARGLGVIPGAWIGPDPARNRREIDAVAAIARRHANVGRVSLLFISSGPPTDSS